MEVLQLKVPPLPQLVKVGHGEWGVGGKHAARSFPVFDLIVVTSGALHITEEDTAYSIGEGELLILEANRPHYGHAACSERTEVYWVHYRHDEFVRRMDSASIAWSEVVRDSSDYDESPPVQYIYLPKYGPYADQQLVILLDEMVRQYERRSMEATLELQKGFVDLLGQLQSRVKSHAFKSRSARVADQVKHYLESHRHGEFHSDRMARELFLNKDYAARCMKKHTGLSPLQYLHHLRMEEAKKLLRSTDLSLIEIGERAGFHDYNYFIRMFRKVVGATPGAYRDSSSSSV